VKSYFNDFANEIVSGQAMPLAILSYGIHLRSANAYLHPSCIGICLLMAVKARKICRLLEGRGQFWLVLAILQLYTDFEVSK
jgi:hypothetical protein